MLYFSVTEQVNTRQKAGAPALAFRIPFREGKAKLKHETEGETLIVKFIFWQLRTR